MPRNGLGGALAGAIRRNAASDCTDGSTLSGPATPGKVIGPSFAADEVPDVIEALIDVYRRERAVGERFVDAARRLGIAPFRAAADAVRRTTAAVAA